MPFGISADFSLSLGGGSAGAVSLGERNDPFAGCNFVVEIEGLLVGGFSEVSGLSVETEVETYREGGLNEFQHKLPGATKYPSNLMLKHGLTTLDTLWQWHQNVVSGIVERKNGTIYLLDNARQPVVGWNFIRACPVKWTGPDLRADSSTVAFETIELVHEGLSRPQAGITVSLGAGVSASASVSLGGGISVGGSFSGGF